MILWLPPSPWVPSTYDLNGPYWRKCTFSLISSLHCMSQSHIFLVQHLFLFLWAGFPHNSTHKHRLDSEFFINIKWIIKKMSVLDQMPVEKSSSWDLKMSNNEVPYSKRWVLCFVQGVRYYSSSHWYHCLRLVVVFLLDAPPRVDFINIA